MSRNSLSRQRKRFLQEHPFCYYCGTRVVELQNGHRGPVPDNAATIEHLRPKMHPQRNEPNRFNLYRHVLACYRCNADKAREFLATRSLEELWRRAGHFVRMCRMHGAINEVA